MAGMTRVSPMLGCACVGDESAEVESADEESASGDVSLSGGSIVKWKRERTSGLGVGDAGVEPLGTN